jgi:hypothetical protein
MHRVQASILPVKVIVLAGLFESKMSYSGRREIYSLRLAFAMQQIWLLLPHTSRRANAESTLQGLAESRPGVQGMKMSAITRIFMAAGLAAGLGCGMAHAQTAGQDMKDAGHDTKNAAVDTGHATKRTTKKVYHKTKSGTKTAYHKTANGPKTATHRTENAGDALAGKPADHPSSTPPR